MLLGLILLAVSSELILSSTRSLANHYQIPSYLLGVFLLSFGSNLPELVIAIQAAIKSAGGLDSSNIIMGDAIGSALTQGSLVIGIIGLVTYLHLPKRRALVHGSFLVLSVVMLLVFALDGAIDREDGISLVAIYLSYIFAALYLRETRDVEEVKRKKLSAFHITMAMCFIAIGFAAIFYSAQVVVSAVMAIANDYGVSDLLVSHLGIGVATSLPELIISIQAIRRNEKGLLLGNIIGSNIFDTLVVPGIAAIIYPLSVASKSVYFDIPLLIILSFGLLFFLLRKKGIQKVESVILLVFFMFYIMTNLFPLFGA